MTCPWLELLAWLLPIRNCDWKKCLRWVTIHLVLLPVVKYASEETSSPDTIKILSSRMRSWLMDGFTQVTLER
uniref:Uncharacterized protein n=1 Tax=Oryza sativa subsp. japonica TaxID=39947 RepID=Q65XT2_ORYSJ|nr:unknown protein [Oryza sativa Japonica Group]